MNNERFFVSRAPLEEHRFGVRAARAEGITEENLSQVVNFCHESQAQFLIARCSTEQQNAAQAMESMGFLLMDTLVVYARDLKKPIPSSDSPVTIRFMEHGEESRVVEVIAETFNGYRSHYHADSKLDRASCDEVYVDWARRSCTNKNVADGVMVASIEGRIVGVHTLRKNDLVEGQPMLTGVTSEAQGRGIYRTFELRAMEWFRNEGLERMLFASQITNTVVQRIWCRIGAEPSHSYYTFHKWFD